MKLEDFGYVDIEKKQKPTLMYRLAAKRQHRHIRSRKNLQWTIENFEVLGITFSISGSLDNFAFDCLFFFSSISSFCFIHWSYVSPLNGFDDGNVLLKHFEASQEEIR